MRMTPWLPFLVLMGLATASTAAPGPRCAPVVSEARVRLTPTMPMGAGFFSLRNPCGTDVVLTGVRSKRFGDVSMHESRLDRGMSRMRPLASVRLRPGERVDFVPGGRHLMLVAPDVNVRVGRPVRIELLFADGRRLPVDFDVRSAAP